MTCQPSWLFPLNTLWATFRQITIVLHSKCEKLTYDIETNAISCERNAKTYIWASKIKARQRQRIK